LAVVSVRRALQSVPAGRRVPGASFARAYSVYTRVSRHLAVPRSYAPPATAGTPSRARRTLTTAGTRRCRFAATTRRSHDSPWTTMRRDAELLPRIGTASARTRAMRVRCDWSVVRYGWRGRARHQQDLSRPRGDAV